jgi:hypothetical protein
MPIQASRRRLALALVSCAFVSAAWSQTAPSSCRDAPFDIPPRPVDALAASAFITSVAGMDERERDRAVRDQLLAGNLPDFLRRLQPLDAKVALPSGGAARLTLCVLADYLSVGSNDDSVLVPMGLDSALAVAERFGFILPTRRIVDLVYQAAAVRLAPQPLPAGDQMRSTAYILRHQQLIDAQRAQAGAPRGVLSAGHKKDLVLTPRLWLDPGHVAIYGWHRAIGAPIQPLSTVHGARYADYSHGVRLVSQTMYVDGVARSVFDVLADARLAPAISDEGPLPQAAELRLAPTPTARAASLGE